MSTVRRVALVSLVLFAPVTAQVSRSSILDEADADKDGRISLKEAQVWGSLQSPPAAADDLTKRFTSKDYDKDGFLEKDELSDWSKTELSYLKTNLQNPVSKTSIIDEADREPKDGVISLKELIAWGVLQKPPVASDDITARFQRRDTNKDGFLDQGELVDFTKNEVDYLLKNLPAPTAPPTAGAVSRTAILDEADADTDGRISLQEALDWGAQQKPPAAPGDLTKRFQSKDYDKDGFLVKDELTNWRNEETSYLKKNLANPVSQTSIIDEADREPKDGRISLQEAIAWGILQTPPVSSSDMKSRFARRDYDQDGFLAKEELTDFTKNEVDYLLKNLPAPSAMLEVQKGHHVGAGSLKALEKAILSSADLDRDGRVSLDEAKAWGAKQNPPLADTILLESFRRHDADEDSFLNLSELSQLTSTEAQYLGARVGGAAALTHIRNSRGLKHTALRKAGVSAAASRIMGQADVNPKDSHISLAEAQAWALSYLPNSVEEDVAQQFQLHDVDRDGFLSLAELSKMPLDF